MSKELRVACVDCNYGPFYLSEEKYNEDLPDILKDATIHSFTIINAKENVKIFTRSINLEELRLFILAIINEEYNKIEWKESFDFSYIVENKKNFVEIHESYLGKLNPLYSFPKRDFVNCMEYMIRILNANKNFNS